MIRGPSGGGKTTLLNILGTLDHPSTGSIGRKIQYIFDFHRCFVEVLGEKIDKTSSDKFLADLRLRKIGNLLLLLFVCLYFHLHDSRLCLSDI